jgi:hypothetical protein
MQALIKLDLGNFTAAVRDYAEATGRDLNEAALHGVKSFQRQLLALTPPGQGRKGGEEYQDAALRKEDQRRGEVAIMKDLARVFENKPVKGKRQEQWSDVDAVHLRLFIAANGQKLRLDKAGFYNVDKRKLSRLIELLKSHVGRLVAGWSAGAGTLGIPLPAWVARHSGRNPGTASLEMSPGHFRYEVSNTAVPPGVVEREMEARVPYAAQLAANSLNREIEKILARQSERFNRAA